MTPDISAETWLGAAGCARGSQTWRGTTPALVAKPPSAKKNSVVRVVPSRPPAAAQGMQPPAGRVHVLRGSGVVQRGQLQFQFVGMMRLDFRLRSCVEEPLDTLVPEAF